MATKGRDYSVKERRGRSPSLTPRKVETGQHMKSLINAPPILERKHALTSTETRKIPIYEKHTVSSTLYALNTIKPPSVDNARLVPQSRVMALKSKFNEKKVTMNTTGLAKTKDVRKPDSAKVIFHGKKQTGQPARLLDTLSSSKDDPSIVTHYEDDKTGPIVNTDILTLDNCDKQRMDREDDDHGILTYEVVGGGDPPCEPPVPTCSQDDSTVDECIHIEHTSDKINQQDPPDKPPGGSDEHHPCLEVDQELDVEQECHEEPTRKEVIEVPKEEERANEDEVVAQRKKETAAYDYVMEEKRLNRVKALVGTFEILISLQCDALQNKCVANNMKLC